MKKYLLFLTILYTFIGNAQIGNLDNSFNQNGSGSSIISKIAKQNNEKIIISRMSSYNGILTKIARLNIDGSIDNTFNCNWITGEIYNFSIQNDGKIIIVGQKNLTSTITTGIVRLNSDGSLDTTFNVGTGMELLGIPLNPQGYIRTCSIQNDGKIIIGGFFNTFNGTIRKGIARLNQDGSLDNTFIGSIDILFYYIGSIIHFNLPQDSVIQNDGKIIIGGRFNNFNGVSVNNIVRLNSDGSLDTTFNVGTGMELLGIPSNSIVSKIIIQNNGKIIIGGSFDTFNGTMRKGIARLNQDGSLDTNFAIGSGFEFSSSFSTTANVSTISIQSDGKIIVGGQFSSFNGTSRYGINRLNDDGSIDNTFNPGSGTGGYNGNSYINDCLIQSDGKIIIVGQFSSYNGTPINGIARIYSGTLNIPNYIKLFLIYPNPVNDNFNIKTDSNLINQFYTIIDELGRVVLNGKLNEADTTINVEQLSKGIYYLRISENSATKFIKE